MLCEQVPGGPGAAQAGWNPIDYEKGFSFVWKYGGNLIAVLAPQPGERILDLGCGPGQLTAEIAQSGAEVTGVDRSGEMIERARANYPALRFEVADARQFRSTEPFDAVFSNAALHWVRPPEEAALTIALALRKGGRFVAEFGGKGNVASLIREMAAAYLEVAGKAPGEELNPWYFPGIADYSRLLENYGLEVRYASLVERPTSLEGEARGLRDWIHFFLKGPVETMPPEIRSAFVDRLEERLRPRLFRSGQWVLDYWRLRIVAVKTA